ncbi:MAG: exosome catalytic subunit dis3 [Trizodia sp. TS-e1964]|nr:MAG: exosome catalytic subunit dis3 [Trizodia sp. TS-e1964]
MSNIRTMFADDSDDDDERTVASKVYVRTTKSGKVQKIAQEIYLRQGVPCSSRLCSECLADAPVDSRGKAMPFILSKYPKTSGNFPHGHYIIPDTNVLLNGLDVFEDPNSFQDVVVLQTVLEELSNRSLPLYHRIAALTKNETKRFYVFCNEFHIDTHVKRDPGESINDRNDRAVRRATKWYAEHLEKVTRATPLPCPAVVMLTDDKDNLRKAKAAGIDASNLEAYISGLHDSDRLLDMLSASRQFTSSRAKPGENVYPEHYSQSKVITGVKAGTLHQGIFNISMYNYLSGSIHVPQYDRPLLVLGRENMNRAIQGDVAVVEVLPEKEWKSPSSQIVEEETINKNDNPDESEQEAVVTEREQHLLQEVAKSKIADKNPQPTARVVGIFKRNWRQYVCHVDSSSLGSASSSGRKQQPIFAIPMDKRIPKIRVRTRQASELVGKRIVITIDSWDRDSRYPMGHFVRSLGELETKGAETEALLLEYDVQYRPFPKAVLDCLPKEGHEWKVPASMEDPGWHGRRDLRELLVCSIDPPGCQDIDDALHARILPNGNFEVGVHIADVSHFVKPRNAMDEEASVRATTVYLVDKRIDMLPMLLGTDLCSLKPYVERYAFSVIWEMTPAGNIVQDVYTKSVIRSREAFSYEAAQLRIDDASKTDELTQGMRTLLMLSKKLRKKRMDAGALNLASPEVKIQMESETSDPVDVEMKKQLATNSLVEEFMLLANISVASKIYSSFPQTALLRRHGAPPHSNFEELANQLLVKRKLVLQTDSSKALASSLDRCVDAAEPFFNTLVRIMATRCMMSAEYFPAGTQAYPEFRHYGLASPIYTHFTSPIRRYADLVAHRQLAAAIGYEPLDASLLGKARLEGVCANINTRHRNAQLAGRASVEYYIGQALKARELVEEGWVMKVFSNGFVVFVPRFGIESLIRLRDLAATEPKAVFDPETYVLETSGSRVLRVELFDKVVVRISDEKEAGTGKRKVRLGLEAVAGR